MKTVIWQGEEGEVWGEEVKSWGEVGVEEAAAHQMAAAGEITKAAKSSPIWTATTRHGPTEDEDPFSLLSVA